MGSGVDRSLSGSLEARGTRVKTTPGVPVVVLAPVVIVVPGVVGMLVTPVVVMVVVPMVMVVVPMVLVVVPMVLSLSPSPGLVLSPSPSLSPAGVVVVPIVLF